MPGEVGVVVGDVDVGDVPAGVDEVGGLQLSSLDLELLLPAEVCGVADGDGDELLHVQRLAVGAGLDLVVGQVHLAGVDRHGQAGQVVVGVGGEGRLDGLAGVAVELGVRLRAVDVRLRDGEGELRGLEGRVLAVLQEVGVAVVDDDLVLAGLDHLLDDVALGVLVGDGVVLASDERGGTRLHDDVRHDGLGVVLDHGLLGGLAVDGGVDLRHGVEALAPRP